jgi:hypothetical protein
MDRRRVHHKLAEGLALAVGHSTCRPSDTVPAAPDSKAPMFPSSPASPVVDFSGAPEPMFGGRLGVDQLGSRRRHAAGTPPRLRVHLMAPDARACAVEPRDIAVAHAGDTATFMLALPANAMARVRIDWENE